MTIAEGKWGDDADIGTAPFEAKGIYPAPFIKDAVGNVVTITAATQNLFYVFKPYEGISLGQLVARELANTGGPDGSSDYLVEDVNADVEWRMPASLFRNSTEIRIRYKVFQNGVEIGVSDLGTYKIVHA